MAKSQVSTSSPSTIASRCGSIESVMMLNIISRNQRKKCYQENPAGRWYGPYCRLNELAGTAAAE